MCFLASATPSSFTYRYEKRRRPAIFRYKAYHSLQIPNG